jgi:dienelactone hydrolase
MKKSLYLIITITFLALNALCQNSENDSVQKTMFYPNLEKGSYDVGFQTMFDFDYSRTYNLSYPIDTSAKKKDPRPIITTIWYPTKKSNEEKQMIYLDYIKIQTQDSKLKNFVHRINEYNQSNSVEYMFYKSSLNKERKTKFVKHLNQPINVYRDATPINEKFPLVIYHAGLGGTLNDNTILCEYLASHGFVVVTSAFQANDYRDVELDWDLERSTKDLDFILKKIKDLPFIDFSKIAAIGHSYGAQAVLGYKADNTFPVSWLIILDTTMDYSPTANPEGFELLTEKLYANNKNLNVPMLVFANPNAKFKVIDSLKNSDRIYAKVKLKHNEFTSLTSFAVFKGLQNRKNKDIVWEKYTLINKYCLNYLKYNIYNDTESKRFLFTEHPKLNEFHEIPKGKSLNAKITRFYKLKYSAKNALQNGLSVLFSLFNL